MNRIILLGRLVKDAEIRYTPNDRVVAQFTLAVDRPYLGASGKKEADFIPVVMWGKQAENIGNTTSKGHRVLVEGRLQIRSYDAKDGSKRYVTEVVADHFEYIEKKGSSGTQGGGFESMGSAAPMDEDIPF